MASLTTTEFNDAVGALAEHFGIERLGTSSPTSARSSRARAPRPRTRSRTACTGCRAAWLPVIATYAFPRVGPDAERQARRRGERENHRGARREGERVPDEKEHVVAGKEADLDAAPRPIARRRSLGAKVAHSTCC
jgi:hypothetical protein